MLLAGCSQSAPAQPVAPAGYAFPTLSGRVVDAANLLPPQDEATIARKLATLEAATGHQFVVVTVNDLGRHSIEDYGVTLGRTWRIGRKGVNDGVLLIVAPNQRKVRIEVGDGLEQALRDDEAASIIRTAILPAFRAGNYPRGIVEGVDAVLREIGLDKRQAA